MVTERQHLLAALSGRVHGGHLGGTTNPNLRGDLLPMDPALAFHGQVPTVQQIQGEGGLVVDRLLVLGSDGQEQDGHDQLLR